MPHSVLVHIKNEESIVGEIEEIPDPTDQVLIISHVRYRDGRDVTYLLPETNTVIYPWSIIHCMEIMPGEGDKEEIVSFIRE